jgi:hypothetical protein
VAWNTPLFDGNGSPRMTRRGIVRVNKFTSLQSVLAGLTVPPPAVLSPVQSMTPARLQELIDHVHVAVDRLRLGNTDELANVLIEILDEILNEIPMPISSDCSEVNSSTVDY